jgi:two-component system copper resistance phosphate regulon response regulator CusR
MKILVVEDDPIVANMVKAGLSSNSHTVELAHDGAEGSFLGRSYEYDAMILDYSLPKKDGLTVCEEVRRAGKLTPIIFLSVADETQLKVAAFKSGADDYVTKPFSIEELCARVKAVSRRPTLMNQNVMEIDDLSLDTEKQTVRRGQNIVRVTRKEFNLLEYMMKHKGVILSRAMIMEHVWTADSDLLSNTVESHIRNLRKKLNNNAENLIGNVPGRGYIIDTAKNLKAMQEK